MPIQPPSGRGRPRAETRLPVTKKWAALVTDAMRSRGIGLRALARELGISHATLGTVTRAQTASSPHVAAIARALDIPLPMGIGGSRATSEAVLSERLERVILAAAIIERHDPAKLDRLLTETLEAAAALIEERSNVEDKPAKAPKPRRKKR